METYRRRKTRGIALLRMTDNIILANSEYAEDAETLRVLNIRVVIHLVKKVDGLGEIIPPCTMLDGSVQYVLLAVDRLADIARPLTSLIDTAIGPKRQNNMGTALLIADDQNFTAAVFLAYLLFNARSQPWKYADCLEAVLYMYPCVRIPAEMRDELQRAPFDDS